METRANYVLIGAFTLAGILGALGFFLWLAKVEVDRQYAYYVTMFEDVTGLGQAGDVRYNGLIVGRVIGLDLDEDDPSLVRVRMELDADTPVNPVRSSAAVERSPVRPPTSFSTVSSSPVALSRLASTLPTASRFSGVTKAFTSSSRSIACCMRSGPPSKMLCTADISAVITGTGSSEATSSSGASGLPPESET